MAADRVDGRVRRLDHAAQQGSGQDDGAQDLGGKVRRLKQFGGPRHFGRIEELGGARDGRFRFRDAGEPVIEQVRDIEQVARRVQRGGPAPASSR